MDINSIIRPSKFIKNNQLLKQAVEYLNQKQPDKSIPLLQKLLRKEPNNLLAHNELFLALRDLGQLEEAKQQLEKAVKINPQFSLLWFNLGIINRELKDLPTARYYFYKAVNLDSKQSLYYTELANLEFDLGLLESADEWFRKAIELDKTNYAAIFNYSELLLLMGDFDKGWTYYEARPSVAIKNSNPRYSKPRWTFDVEGERVLVHAEQGLGDTLQFVRYVKKLQAIGCHVILEVQDRLVPLLQTQPWINYVIDCNEPVPEHDAQIPLMSIPYWFSKTEQTIPNQVRYIKPDKELVIKWKKLLIEGQFNIGFSCNSNGGKGHLAERGCPVECFNQLANFFYTSTIPKVRLWSLHKEDWFTPIDVDGAFTDTAAIIANLDLVITIDTSIAHLAGAMGKPTWVLLPWMPNWRWQLDRTDNPWYPTVKLYRQPKLGDWDSVFEQVKADLKKLVQ